MFSHLALSYSLEENYDVFGVLSVCMYTSYEYFIVLSIFNTKCADNVVIHVLAFIYPDNGMDTKNN